MVMQLLCLLVTLEPLCKALIYDCVSTSKQLKQITYSSLMFLRVYTIIIVRGLVELLA